MFRTAKSKAGVLTLAAVIVGVPVVGFAGPAGAATRTVTNCLDDNSAGSLRATIAAAGPGDTINFSVTCPPSTPIVLKQGPIVIGQNLTINGPGANRMAVDGNNTTQVLDITSGVVTINGITIQHGQAAATPRGGLAVAEGGGIFNGGTLTLNGSSVSNNTVTATNNGNILAVAEGGGIFNGGTLTLNGSSVSNNTVTATSYLVADALGGGIVNDGTLNVNLSSVSNNTVTATAATGNQAIAVGGGMYNGEGTLAVGYSLVWNNTVTETGGGSSSYTCGGGICTDNGSGTVGYSIVSHNTMSQIGSIGVGTITVTKSITT